jgi:hypothetical protein
MIGVDPHKGSHTAVAIDGSERQLGRLRVRAGAAPGRAAGRMGGAVAGPVLGGGGRGRAGAPARSAAGRGRRAGAGHPAQARLSGAAALLGVGEQERPERRPVRRGRRAALAAPPRGARRRPGDRAEAVGQAAPGPGPAPQPGRLPSSSAKDQPDSGARSSATRNFGDTPPASPNARPPTWQPGSTALRCPRQTTTRTAAHDTTPDNLASSNLRDCGVKLAANRRQ